MTIPGLVTHPEVGELQRHLDVGVGRHATLLHETLAVHVKHQEMQVHVVRQAPRHAQTLRDHVPTLRTEIITSIKCALELRRIFIQTAPFKSVCKPDNRIWRHVRLVAGPTACGSGWAAGTRAPRVCARLPGICRTTASGKHTCILQLVMYE